MNAVDAIRRKRDGHALDPADVRAFVRGYTDGAIADYQAAAWLMAVYFRGLDGAELAALTDAMLHSGDVLDLSDIAGAKVDKHSTGGVGDKISLHLAPAVAACGVRVPMISGRGLGHTGGTLDKLESIPGFSVDLTVEKFREVLADCGLALIGQTERLAPADKKLYALRDVTGTVESIPLIAASIMSKKLAEGIDGLVLDVKVGSGAFMKTLERARELAETLVEIGRRAGKRVSALITDMDQPLGRWVGNAVEVHESIEVLSGRGEPDLVELTLALGGEMLVLGGVARDLDDGRARIARSLEDGSALARFRRCVELQGGNLPQSAEETRGWFASDSVRVTGPAGPGGFVQAIDAEQIGLAALALGAGRQRKEDEIDPGTWIWLKKKVGERVEPGDDLAWFSAPRRGAREQVAAHVTAQVRAAYTVGDAAPKARPLVLEVIR
ncbi:MAG TPA: thymidine phosphorylase [Polyangia bacterium]|nr:thymidine phosphorylase [Polyangia bacterium]